MREKVWYKCEQCYNSVLKYSKSFARYGFKTDEIPDVIKGETWGFKVNYEGGGKLERQIDAYDRCSIDR